MRSLFFFLLLISQHSFAQNPKILKFNKLEEFIIIQNDNLSKIDLSMTKDQVKSIMGESVIIAYKGYSFIGREKLGISQPKFRDLTRDSSGNNIEILWYKAELYKEGKDGCSPIILQNNSVIGIGWAMFEDYRKSRKFQISIN